jgi:hypothetical protein
MNKIITFLVVFLIFNFDTLFSQGGFDASGKWVDHSGEYYHSTWYNFHIYGDVELKEINSESNTEYYYALILHEPIVFTKGFASNGTLIQVTVGEIQLLFADNELKNKIDLKWKAHIINGKLYFSENIIYHTPVIMIVDRVNVICISKNVFYRTLTAERRRTVTVLLCAGLPCFIF